MEQKMKSRFYLAFVLAGIAPIVGLAGFYLYTAVNQVPTAPKAPVATSVTVNAQQQQTEVQTIASSLFNAIKTTNADAANLAAHNTSADLQNFINTHTGVAGAVVVNAEGKSERVVPATLALVDSHYGSNPEFQKIVSKFKENQNKNYQFYTNRLGYPAFVFAVPLAKGSFAEVVLKVANFFKGIGSNGPYFILEAGSGQFLYHSDNSKLNTLFNPQHEPWLSKVQDDLSAQKSGVSPNGNSSAAAYGYLGFGKFGVVHTFSTIVAAPAATKLSSNGLPESVFTPMSLGFVLALALLFIGAGIASRILAAPFRRVINVILAAAEDSATLTPEIVKSFGNDVAGQIVQALALYNENIQHSKTAAVQNLTDQINNIQKQTRQYEMEVQEKNQQLTDKLRELGALKGMTEGLRNQSEQAKNENARLKSELAAVQNAQLELATLQNKYTQLQDKVKNTSPAQVSQVRAAAIRTMSEELKNTLGIIKGYVSSVIGAGQGGINEKQQEFLGMVINRSARLEKFINDLVDIYQVEIEQKEAKTEEVNLASEIEAFAFNFQTQIDLKNLKIKVEAKPALPKVPVVRRRMIQLWNILYLQLIKDSPKGSTISIVVEPAGDKVKVTVQDPGLIVVPNSLPKLFDEFYDPKHQASPQLAGTGLKLALVKTILTAHGGTAVAEKADIGTRLIFTFATKATPATIPPYSTKSEFKPPAPGVAPISGTSAPGTSPSAKGPVSSNLDLIASFGLKPPAAPVSPAPPSALPTAAPPVPNIVVPNKIPVTPSSESPTALPPIPGLTVGAKPPAGDASASGTLEPLPPIAGLVVGAKPPSAGTPVSPASSKSPSTIPASGIPKPIPVPGVLDALISGKIPSVTSPGIKPAAVSPATPPPVPPAPPKPFVPIPPSTMAGAPGVPSTSKPGPSLEDLLKPKPQSPPPPPPISPTKPLVPPPEDDLLE
jgi:signal transduction histidine kinase